MSGEKTEKATPKRRRDARQKGQIAKSTEVNAAVVLLLIYLGMALFGAHMSEGLRVMFTDFLSGDYLASPGEMAINMQQLYLLALKYFVIICGPLLLISVLAAMLTSYAQVGFLFLPTLMNMKFDRINPASGMKRIFSVRTMAEFLKAVIKMLIVGLVVYFEFKNRFLEIPNLVYTDIVSGTSVIWGFLMTILWKTGLTYLVFSVFDYAYQRWEYEKSLKMSKQEVKQEYKMTEGDPQIKARIREIQRHISMRRMMQRVREADVVITNPTHFAVALLYDEKKSTAPVVIAKGQDLIALRIKEEAKEYKVHIVENKPLAQTLYKTTDIDQAIPEDLYQAVAEILAAVYRVKRR